MILLFVTVVVLATWHYLYEGLITPTIMASLRNELFALRDEIRMIKIDNPSLRGNDNQVLYYVHDGINFYLERLPFLTLSHLIKAMKVNEKDAKFRKIIDERVKALDLCEDKRIVNIFERSTKVVKTAYIANMGAWFIYLIPIALVIMLLERLKHFVSDLILLPTYEAKELIPQVCSL